jgi:amino acid transporter
MKRSISSVAMLFASISAIIGSGWLFSSYYAATLAGPAALISWLIGGFVAVSVAFVFGELSSLLPVTGFSARVPQFTHGTVVGFLFSWITWLSYAACVPAEVQAIIQYLAFYFPTLIQNSGALTHSGYVAATFLMLLVSVINAYSLRWLIRSNNFITVLKLIIPVIISVIIMYYFFKVDKIFHPVNSIFMPYGVHGVLAAVTSGGIVFAFNGFKQAAEMAGEAKNPKFALPFAIIGSIVACLVVFLLLQIALLVSLQPNNLVNGWQNLVLPSGSSPLAAIISQNNLSRLLPILYLCAILAPLAAAMMYCSSASRSIFGMSKNKYLPAFFQKLSAQGNPIYAVLANFVVGMLIFAPLPGWANIATFLSSLMVITYSVGPVALLALRQQVPNHPKTFHLPVAKFWATGAFYICTLLIFWCGWNIISKLGIAFAAAILVIFVYYLKHVKTSQEPLYWKQSTWLWSYIAGLVLISWLGSFGGGRGAIPFGLDFPILAVFSMFIMWLALKFKLASNETQKYIDELKSEL